jgi:hypothetical protein
MNKWRVASMRLNRDVIDGNTKLEDFKQKRCSCGIKIDCKDDKCEYCKRFEVMRSEFRKGIGA